MVIAKITGQGLTAISVLVVLLWACIAAERITIRQANLEARRTMQDLRSLRMKRRAIPASTPMPRVPRPARPTVG